MNRINKNQVDFILVEPRTPGNIGAAARAIKTMGFSNLVLVNPGDHLDREARWMAHASEDILENARVCDSLEEAIAESNFVVATTQRERGYHFPFFTPEELREKIMPVSAEHRAAIVFGRERTGLTNEELQCCHAITTIPAAISHPSLNLAQAVMVYAYELSKTSFGKSKTYQWNYASDAEIRGVYQHLEASLRGVNFIPHDSYDSFLMRFRRLFGRAHPEVRDVRLMHKILQAFDEYISRLKKDER